MQFNTVSVFIKNIKHVKIYVSSFAFPVTGKKHICSYISIRGPSKLIAKLLFSRVVRLRPQLKMTQQNLFVVHRPDYARSSFHVHINPINVILY